MKKIALIIVMVICAGLLGGCGNNASGNTPGALSPDGKGYHKITAAQAKAIMDSGQKYTLVDVRTESEYTAQRIAGAILIPVDEIQAKAPSQLPDKDAMILTYCRSGVRSGTAAHTLVSLGYTNVYDMGGIIDWPYDTVSG